jgi:hypothetical protein
MSLSDSGTASPLAMKCNATHSLTNLPTLSPHPQPDENRPELHSALRLRLPSIFKVLLLYHIYLLCQTSIIIITFFIIITTVHVVIGIIAVSGPPNSTYHSTGLPSAKRPSMGSPPAAKV